MKAYTSIILTLILGVFFISCSEVTEQSEAPEEIDLNESIDLTVHTDFKEPVEKVNSEVKSEEAVKTQVTNKVKDSKGMKTITPFTSEIELKIGEKVSYTGTVHGSVGIQKECWSKDESLLQLIHKKLKYNNKFAKGSAGGDRATETYIFKALEEGETTITIQDWYRGDMEIERTVKVIITK